MPLVYHSVGAGEVDTVQAPVLLTVPVTKSRPTATLFASYEPSAPPSPPPSPPPPPPSPPPTVNPTYPSGTVIISISTPPPSVFVSEVSSTGYDGSVFTTYLTFTSTLAPTPVFLPAPSTTGDNNNTNDNHSHSASNDIGPIVGGVLGGFFGLIGVVALGWFIWRKKESWQDRYAGPPRQEYEPALYSPRQRRPKSSPPPGLEPKPYEYGIVGPCSSPSTSPPPTRPQSFTALSAMNAYASPMPGHNPSTPNLLHTTSPVAPARPITPMTPLSPPYFGNHGHSGSEASVGTAVSYPFPVLPPTPRNEASRDSVGELESVSERRTTRLSLTLANWNPETDGELFARASSDDGRAESVRHRGEEGRAAAG
ncbi:hypothetical protein C8Q78DRAFT_1070664 [Trametes maxima]|nr:hypothetical protein C8Q78DRAFT_1070664 [Trametes maxima]